MSQQLTFHNVPLLNRNFEGRANRFDMAQPEDKRRSFTFLVPDSRIEDCFRAGLIQSDLVELSRGIKVKVRPANLPEHDYFKSLFNINCLYHGRWFMLNETHMSMLDDPAAIVEASLLIINLYPWSVNGRSGTSAYLEFANLTYTEGKLEDPPF